MDEEATKENPDTSTNEESSLIVNNINADEIDEETERKLRGDAIGDTLYSSSFVVKTLLKFQQFQWDKDFEEDLCFLWDMTLEKDVCKYLFQLSYPSLCAAAVLKNGDENRFVEIVVGILGNMFCATCNKHIQLEERDVILSLLNSEDPLILIQVLRFIKALSFTKDKCEFITEDIIKTVTFILSNSINQELLVISLDTLSKLTLDFKISCSLVSGALFHSVLIAYLTLKKCEDFNFENQQTRTVFTHLVQIVSNFCVYINHADNKILVEIMEYKNVFLDEVCELLKHYASEETLIPVPEEFAFYFDAFGLIFSTLSVNYIRELFLRLFKIFELCIINDCEYDFALELLSYFISNSLVDDLYRDVMRCKNVKICLNKLKDIDDTNVKFKANLDILCKKVYNKC